MAYRTQENTNFFAFTSLLQRIQLRNSQVEEMNRAEYEGWRGYGASIPSSLHHPPSKLINVFTNPEAHQISLFKSF